MRDTKTCKQEGNKIRDTRYQIRKKGGSVRKRLLVVAVSVVIFGFIVNVVQPVFAIEQKVDYRLMQKIEKAVESLSSKKGNESRQAKKNLIKWGGASVEPLLEVAKDWKGQEGALRVKCVDILGELKDDRAVPVLISVLGEKKMTMRYNAAKALGKIGDNKAVPALIKLLSDPEWEVRFFTVEAIGDIGDVQAAKPLSNVLLSDSNKEVRLAAVEALDKIDARSETGVVVDALSDDDAKVRGYAAELAASWKIVDAEATVVNMLRNDRVNVARASCAHALGIYGNIASVPALIQALRDDYKDVRIYAEQSLKKISGQSYGSDQDAWSRWFELNKDKTE
ncbi:HEAT repeat domain-containing protein [Candidatus Omnitrophota bacterium]